MKWITILSIALFLFSCIAISHAQDAEASTQRPEPVTMDHCLQARDLIISQMKEFMIQERIPMAFPELGRQFGALAKAAGGELQKILEKQMKQTQDFTEKCLKHLNDAFPLLWEELLDINDQEIQQKCNPAFWKARDELERLDVKKFPKDIEILHGIIKEAAAALMANSECTMEGVADVYVEALVDQHAGFQRAVRMETLKGYMGIEGAIIAVITTVLTIRAIVVNKRAAKSKKE